MLTFHNPEILTVDSARVKSFAVFFASDPAIPSLTPPVVRATVEVGTQANEEFAGARTFTVTILSPAAERIASDAKTIVRALLEHMQDERFLPSGTIQE